MPIVHRQMRHGGSVDFIFIPAGCILPSLITLGAKKENPIISPPPPHREHFFKSSIQVFTFSFSMTTAVSLCWLVLHLRSTIVHGIWRPDACLHLHGYNELHLAFVTMREMLKLPDTKLSISRKSYNLHVIKWRLYKAVFIFSRIFNYLKTHMRLNPLVPITHT